jgi:acetyltransferase-like isoleucine patch superfamily enzyme
MRKVLQKLLIKIFPELSQLKNRNYDFSKLRSYQKNVSIGVHVKINPVFVITNVEIDNYTYISENSIISNTTIGKFCSIGPNLLCGWGIHPTNGISTAPMFYSASNKPNGMSLSVVNKVEEYRTTTIGNDVFIGANVTIIDGVKIGDGAVIGAGAVVSKDIPPYAIAVGSPIQIKSYRFSEKEIQDLMRIEWWNFSEEKLQDVERLFFDVELFIAKHRKT